MAADDAFVVIIIVAVTADLVIVTFANSMANFNWNCLVIMIISWYIELIQLISEQAVDHFQNHYCCHLLYW